MNTVQTKKIWLGENAEAKMCFNLRDTKLLYPAHIENWEILQKANLKAVRIKFKILETLKLAV